MKGERHIPGRGCAFQIGIAGLTRTAPRYEITAAAAQRVGLRVYDLLGREVRTLVDGVVAPGRHEAHWDGRDNSGCPVARGVYLVRLQVGRSAAVRRLMLLG